MSAYIKEADNSKDIVDEFPTQLTELEDFFSAFMQDLFPQKSCFWLWEFPSEKLFLNSPTLGFKKYSGKERIWQEQIHPLDRDKFIAHLDNLIKTKSSRIPSFLSHRIKTSQEGYQQVFTKFQIISCDDEGNTTRIIAISFDIETVENLKKLQKEASNYSHVLDAIKGGVWEWDTETNKSSYSPYYAVMMGYDPDHYKQNLTSWSERVHPSDIDKVMNYQYSYINFPDFGNLFESSYRFLAADDTYKWITSKAKVIQRNDMGRATRIIGVHTLTDNLYEANLALTDKAYTDHLTGLSNRLAFDTKLATLTKKEYPVSLIYIDVDGLKQVNDKCGHKLGDHLLKTMTQLIRQSFRSNDMIARLGGDEFVVLLPNCSLENAEKLVRGIRLLCQEYNNNLDNLPVFISAGIASTDEGIDLFHLQIEADRKMIKQKRKEAKQNYKKLNQWIANHTDKLIK